jgi:hypothetical protein
MKNVLIIGGTSVEPKEKENLEALLLKKLGYNVTVHFTATDESSIEKLNAWFSENGIISYGEIVTAIDWERLGKELKTHQHIIVKTNAIILPALDLAKVYGRDVWCTIDSDTESVFANQCDYTFKLSEPFNCNFGTNKMCVSFREGGHIHYYERGIDALNFKIEGGTADWNSYDLGAFMSGFIYAFDKGEYTHQCLKYGFAVRNKMKKGTPVDVENIFSTEEMLLQALESE